MEDTANNFYVFYRMDLVICRMAVLVLILSLASKTIIFFLVKIPSAVKSV